MASLTDSVGPRISLKKPSVSQEKRSIVSFHEERQVDQVFLNQKHPKKSTLSRNPEEPTTDNQFSMRNTHLNVDHCHKG